MNNTDISLKKTNAYIDNTEIIEFGMKNYIIYWADKTPEASNDEHKKALDSVIYNMQQNCGYQTKDKKRLGEFCIVVTPEYKVAIAVYDIEKQCYRIAADIVCFDNSKTQTNIIWKKFRFINGTDTWKKNKNGSYKSIKGIKARCIDIADEEAIALIGDENKILETENIYYKKGNCKK